MESLTGRVWMKFVEQKLFLSIDIWSVKGEAIMQHAIFHCCLQHTASVCVNATW